MKKALLLVCALAMLSSSVFGSFCLNRARYGGSVSPRVGGIVLDLNGTEIGPALSDGVWAGAYWWDFEYGIQDFKSFCMDVTVDPPMAYTCHTVSPALDDWEWMWGTYYGTISDSVGNDAIDAAALQLAFWEHVHETSGTYDLASGDFFVKSLNTSSVNNNGATMAGLISAANAILDSNNWTAKVPLELWHADGYQPFLVPEPATLGLLALGSIALLRRKR